MSDKSNLAVKSVFASEEAINTNEGHPVEAHPVLITFIGSTMAEEGPLVFSKMRGQTNLVPYKLLFIDSLPLEDLITRIVQNGWKRNQVEETITKDNYLQLKSPFVEDFDFENPLNRRWKDIIFDEYLKRIAKRPESPGCAGTPAMGRARVEGNIEEITEFFERHLLTLTQVRLETLALQEGVKCFFVTSFRGGTGTGATAYLAAILRSVVQSDEIHLHAVMPCVYGGDPRAYANAYAALIENQFFHRFKGGVPIANRIEKSPFTSINLTFSNNGAVSLGPKDALMQELALLTTELKAPTQQASNDRYIDLTDIGPCDVEENPTHVQIQSGLAIYMIPEGLMESLALTWLHKELEDLQTKLDSYLESRTLDESDEVATTRLLKDILKRYSLNIESLTGMIDTTPSAMKVLRDIIEKGMNAVTSMKHDAIKKGLSVLPSQIQGKFTAFEASWEKGALKLEKSLTEIAESALKSSVFPSLGIIVFDMLLDEMSRLAEQSKDKAKAHEKKRVKLGEQFARTIKEAQEASGILGFLKRDEIVKDLAIKSFSLALAAGTARIQQQLSERLSRVLDNVIRAIHEKRSRFLIETKKHYKEMIDSLESLSDIYSKKMSMRSHVFQRSILYDDLSGEALDEFVDRLRSKDKRIPLPVESMLKGEISIQQACQDMQVLLPDYNKSSKTIWEVLRESPDKKHLVMQILKSLKPFTKIDREVEDQQSLRNRRDNFKILELPGGKESELARWCLNKGIVPDLNYIVDSGGEEIRLYMVRGGLPLYAVRSLETYLKKYEDYIEKAEGKTPHTLPDSQNLNPIKSPQTNLRDNSEMIVYQVKAVFPELLKQNIDESVSLHFEQYTAGGDFLVSKDKLFHDMNSLIVWLSKHIRVRKYFEGKLQESLRSDSENYCNMLTKAWENASGDEANHLQRILYSFKIDPRERIRVNGGWMKRLFGRKSS